LAAALRIATATQILASAHHEVTKALKRHSRNRSQLFADMAVVEILANREEFTV